MILEPALCRDGTESKYLTIVYSEYSRIPAMR